MRKDQAESAFERVNLPISHRTDSEASFSLIANISDHHHIVLSCLSTGQAIVSLAEYRGGPIKSLAKILLDGAAAEPITVAMIIDHLASTDWEDQE